MAEQGPAGLVDVDDGGPAQDEDAFEGGLGELAEAFLAFAQGLLGPPAQFDGLGLEEVLLGQARNLVGDQAQGPAHGQELLHGHDRHLGQGGHVECLIGPDLLGVGPHPLVVVRDHAYLPHHPVGHVAVAHVDARAAVPQAAAQARPHDRLQGVVRAERGVRTLAIGQSPGRAAHHRTAQSAEPARSGDGPAVGFGDDGSHVGGGGKGVLDLLDRFQVEDVAKAQLVGAGADRSGPRSALARGVVQDAQALACLQFADADAQALELPQQGHMGRPLGRVRGFPVVFFRHGSSSAATVPLWQRCKFRSRRNRRRRVPTGAHRTFAVSWPSLCPRPIPSGVAT